MTPERFNYENEEFKRRRKLMQNFNYEYVSEFYRKNIWTLVAKCEAREREKFDYNERSFNKREIDGSKPKRRWYLLPDKN